MGLRASHLFEGSVTVDLWLQDTQKCTSLPRFYKFPGGMKRKRTKRSEIKGRNRIWHVPGTNGAHLRPSFQINSLRQRLSQDAKATTKIAVAKVGPRL